MRRNARQMSTVWFLAVEDDDGIAALVVIGLPFVHDVLLLDSP